MRRYLLDVNVLFALLWSRHASHAAAHAWFSRSGHQAWATSPLTQLGVLRLLTNPAVTMGAVRAPAALDVLQEAASHPRHEFWALGRGFPAGLKPFANRVRGHRQWPDLVLLWQAAERDGVLVTFDSGVRDLAATDLGAHVLLLESH